MLKGLKIGSKVRVKSDLTPLKPYEMKNGYVITFVEPMLKFKGEIVTISKASENSYRIVEDGGMWSWADEMFELKDNLFTLKELEG